MSGWQRCGHSEGCPCIGGPWPPLCRGQGVRGGRAPCAAPRPDFAPSCFAARATARLSRNAPRCGAGPRGAGGGPHLWVLRPGLCRRSPTPPRPPRPHIEARGVGTRRCRGAETRRARCTCPAGAASRPSVLPSEWLLSVCLSVSRRFLERGRPHPGAGCHRAPSRGGHGGTGRHRAPSSARCRDLSARRPEGKRRQRAVGRGQRCAHPASRGSARSGGVPRGGGGGGPCPRGRAALALGQCLYLEVSARRSHMEQTFAAAPGRAP